MSFRNNVKIIRGYYNILIYDIFIVFFCYYIYVFSMKDLNM